MNGKGSAQRPTDKRAYDKNYDDIFSKYIECPGCQQNNNYRNETELTCFHCGITLFIHSFEGGTVICKQEEKDGTKTTQRSLSMQVREESGEL